MIRYRCKTAAILLFACIIITVQGSGNNGFARGELPENFFRLLPRYQWQPYNGLNPYTSTYPFVTGDPVKPVVEFDADNGMIVVYERAFGVRVSPLYFYPMNSYLDEVSRLQRRGLQQRYFKEQMVYRPVYSEEEGLVPDITIPAQLPGRLGRVLGKGGGLKVSGFQKVSLSGESDYYLDVPETDWRQNSAFPSLAMDQQLVLNLEGTVGEKVHVYVDHDSERDFESKNSVRVTYEGDEDEIIQRIEGGDTQISLPSTEFVSGGGYSKGLFGAKIVSKIGGLELTGVISKEKGTSEKGTFLGRATIDTLQVADIEYIDNKFFGIELDSLWEEGTVVAPSDSIVSLSVYFDDRLVYNNDAEGAVPGVAWLDPDVRDPSAEYHQGNFVQLRNLDDYYYSSTTGIIQLTNSFTLDDNYVLAVAYELADGAQAGVTSGDTLHLKLLHPATPTNQSRTWNYELRNAYYLSGTDIDGSQFSMKIRRKSAEAGKIDLETQGGESYLHLFGFDNVNTLGDSIPDGNVDLNAEMQNALKTGILIFPDQKPFIAPFLYDENVNPYIYSMRYRDLEPNLHSLFYLEIIYKVEQATFNLGHLNIINGSEVVRVNGVKQTRNRDYIILYDIGQVSFLTPPPSDAEVTIDYEYEPLFGIKRKTLIGVRGDYILSDAVKFGSTWLYEGEKSNERRPRVGYETGRNVVGNFDLSMEYEPERLTGWIDALPLVETDTPSSIAISGEIAANFPNPNVRDDAYIDDMEGVRESYPILGSRRSWNAGSLPLGKLKQDVIDFRWYNPDPKDLPRKEEIYRDLSEEERDDRVNVLRLEIMNAEGGGYGFGSIHQLLSPYDLDFKNSKFLEMWVNAGAGSLYVDLGYVSEDQLRRGRAEGDSLVFKGEGILNTEDANYDGVLDNDEDTGIDGVEGDDDRWTYDPFLPDSLQDDGNDDFFYDEGEFERINGTEDNNFLDTEDLDGDGVLNRVEYFFRIPFDLSKNLGYGPEIVEQRGNWKLYRIPLRDPAYVSEQSTGAEKPDWRRIKYARLWVTGFTEDSELEIASLNIVGNKWIERDVGSRDGSPVSPVEQVITGYVNLRENAEYDHPPWIDPGRDEEGRKRNEASLALIVKNLGPNHYGRAVQTIPYRQDYTLYRKVEFSIHGGAYSPEFFFQFGADSLNYYEISTRVEPGWQRVTVDFNDLIDFKKSVEDTAELTSSRRFESGNFAIRGSPSLAKVQRLTLGVINTSEKIDYGKDDLDARSLVIVEDEVWVDDIKLLDVRKDVGKGGRISLNIKGADLLTVDGSVYYRDSEFHGLGANRGSGTSIRDESLRTTFALGHLFPPAWGLRMPLEYRFARSQSFPKYSIGSDIILDSKESERQRGINRSQNFSFSHSKTTKSSNPFIRHVVDRISTDFSISSVAKDSYTAADTTQTINTSISWNWSPDHDHYILLPVIKKVYYLPQSLRLADTYYSTDVARYQKLEGTIDPGGKTTVEKRTTSPSFDMTYTPFSSFNTNYRLSTVRDLNIPLAARAVGWNIGREIQRNQDVGVTYNPRFAKWFDTFFNYTSAYAEDHRPELSIGREEDVRDAEVKSRFNSTLTFHIQNLFQTAQQRDGTSQEQRISSGGRPGSDGREILPPQDGMDGTVDDQRDDATPPERPTPLTLLRNLWGVRKLLSPFKFQYTRDASLDNNGLADRPGWLYQFGLEELFGLSRLKGIDQVSGGIYDGETLSETYQLIGGISASDRLSIQSTYRLTHTEQSYQSSSRIRDSVRWPDVQFTLNRVENWVVIRGIARSSSINSSFSRDMEESRPAGGDIDEKTSQTTWAPLLSWQTTWKNNFITLLSYSTAETIRERNPETAQSGKTRERSKTLTANLNYTLQTKRGISSPVFFWMRGNRWRLQSNVRLNLSFTRNYSSREEYGSFGWSYLQRTRMYSIKPGMSYNFSRNIEGGAEFNFARSKDLKGAGGTRQTIGITIWTVFRF
jgi:hypothetical protein